MCMPMLLTPSEVEIHQQSTSRRSSGGPLIDDVVRSRRRAVRRGSLRVVTVGCLKRSGGDDLVNDDVAENGVLEMLAEHVDMCK